MNLKLLGAATALVFLVAGAANAATKNFTATLDGASENPAITTSGTGQLKASLDTTSKVLTYSVTYSGLSGPAQAAHFHGPAAPGVNGGVAVPATVSASPITGTATLNDAQIADLEAGKWYFNIHTALHGGGEIRGQVKAAP